MSEVQQLISSIEQHERQIEQLERKLRTIQQTCDHVFIDNRTYKKCSKCHLAKSVHY